MKSAYLASIAILYCSLHLQAESIDAAYRISFGILGEVGRAKAHLERNETSYYIEIEGRSTNLAKSISRDRREKQTSEGYIKNGLLVPLKYTILRSYSNKRIKKEYTIDHKHKTVERLDVRVTDGRVVHKEQKRLDYYAENDLLTLYFNMSRLILDKERSAHYTFKALGAEKQHGDVEIIVVQKDAGKLDKRVSGGGGYWYLTALIHQKIFSSSRGELLLSVDKNGITHKAVLKDVLFFGDIRAELME